MSNLICPLCPVERTVQLNLDLKNYLKHIKLFHSHQPSFSIMCGLGGCLRTFNNFQVFRNHISAYHSSDPMLLDEQSTHIQSDGNIDDESVGGVEETSSIETSFENLGSGSRNDLQKSTAIVLMGLKEKYKLTQVALQGVIESTTSLVQCRLSELYSQVRDKLLFADVSSDIVSQLELLFTDNGAISRPFMGLETEHQQIIFYRTHFNLIEPVRITLGQRRVWKGSGAKRRCVTASDEMMYVPLLDSLQSILNVDIVFSELLHGHKDMYKLSDFCDGEVYRTHPLFSMHSTAIQLFFYYDDLEVCNPLGSKAKIHKLSIFYFTLGNLPPKQRSKLTSIYLVAITKHKNLSHYGMDAILHPFIEDVKKLENGYDFKVHGESKHLFGTLCLISADNLGSQALGGFKESCSAYRYCRQCMATHESAATKFTESEFLLRDKSSHADQCAEVLIDPDASREYGINRNSSLNNLRYFHVCDGVLIPDVMHDLLEGALQYEVKLLLRHFIQTECYFSLHTFNLRLSNLELGYMETKDRPTPIAESTLTSSGHSLKQAAAQMWLLGRILPLIVGDLVPDDDDRWLNYLKMMEIVDLLFCSSISEDNCAYLAVLISDHHREFAELYQNDSVIPKMHFMVHMARLILRFGPLVRHWTMRYEAKHAYFKSLAHVIGSFKNIAFTLATRHQQYSCYCNETQDHGNQISVGPGSVVPPSVLKDNLDGDTSTVFETKWVKVDGIEYKKGAGLIYSVDQDELPQVIKVSSIYVVDGSFIVFKGECFTTQYYPHFRVYKLQSLNSNKYVQHCKLYIHVPLHIRACTALNFINVVLPYYIFS